jgi:hypothetical protein
MKYNLDFDKFVNLSVPIYYSKWRIKNLIKCLVLPIGLVYWDFRDYRDAVILKTSYTSQQGSLSALFNKIFAADIGLKRFTIRTFSDIKPKYYAPIIDDSVVLDDPIYVGLSSEVETQPKYVGFGFEYNNAKSFVINAPIEVMPREAELKSWANYYRFESKEFIINYF